MSAVGGRADLGPAGPDLIARCRALIEDLLSALTPTNHDLAVEIGVSDGS